MAGKGIPLAMIGIGGVFAWSGLFNKTVTQTIQDLVKGQKPVPGPSGMPPVVAGTGAGAVAGGSATGQAIAVDALAYEGQGYEWGGAPATGLGHWDCSSFVNWVVGHDLHMSIPGFPNGSYTGASHGPTTLTWLASIGTLTTRIPFNQMQAGDLCVWQTHMGIAINGTQFISAENPSNGTRVDTVKGFIPGEILSVLRLKASAAPPPSGGGGRKK
jgi:cell wall-associated NlpC family hydrolase